MFPFHFPAISQDRQDRFYTKPALITILILAAVLRFAFLVEVQANPMPVMVSQNSAFDQFNYTTMAYDIMKNHWLGSQHPGQKIILTLPLPERQKKEIQCGQICISDHRLAQ